MIQKLFPGPKAMKIPEAKAAVDKEWGHFQRLQPLEEANGESKPEVIRQQKEEANGDPVATVMDIFSSSKYRSLDDKLRKTADVLYSEATSL